MRREVADLIRLGPLPDSSSAALGLSQLESYQRALSKIASPVSDEEAAALTQLFGPDDSFGLAWSLLHLIESAPHWPLIDRLPAGDNPWIQLLRERAERARRVSR